MNNNLLKNKKVAILGAGPVGITMAKLLQQKGIAVSVYERDKDPKARIWGGTLDLHKGSGIDAMEKAGLLESYFAMAIPMGRTLTNEQGKVLFTKEPDHENPEINRNDLRTILLNSLTNGTVVWDRKFTGLEARNEAWLLHFDTNADTTADLVIGANGGLSNARKYITDTQVESTGSFIIQGEVFNPEINCAAFYQLCGGNILMTTAKGISLVANANNNGALTYNVMFRTPKEWNITKALDFQNSDSIIAYLTSLYSDWNECFKELFRATSSFVGLPTRKMPMDNLWKSYRSLPITLIGDAAHIMPPFAGEGVNIGLLDTIILSENLTNGKFETIDDAINDYEQKMFVYAKEAQLQTSNNEIKMFEPDFSFQKMIR